MFFNIKLFDLLGAYILTYRMDCIGYFFKQRILLCVAELKADSFLHRISISQDLNERNNYYFYPRF